MQDKDTRGLPGQISTRTSDIPMAFRLGFLGRWGAWIVLLVSLLTSFATWHIVKGEATKRAQARFYFQVKAIETGIYERLKAYELLLMGGVGLFEASAEVTREDWQLYVKTLRIDQHYPGIQGVGFSRRILPTEKAAHLRQIRSEGFPQYTIKPDGERLEYTSIIFLEPFDSRNQRAFGYDMFSEATRKEAMIRARDTGKTALSGRVALVQETDNDVQTGFLLYVAVYRKGESLGTPEQRRNALMGYVYSPFRMNNFMQGIVAGDEARVNLQIFDGDKPLKETLLYQSGTVEKPHHSPEDRHFATHQSILEYAGHRWLLEFASSKYFENQIETGLTTFILMLGITISLLLFGMVLSLTHSRGQAIVLANMTLNLEKANIGLKEEITERKRAEETILAGKQEVETILQTLPCGVIVIDADTHEIIDANPATCKLIGATLDQIVGHICHTFVCPAEKGACPITDKGHIVDNSDPVLINYGGQHIPIVKTVTRITLNGRNCLLESFVDITERKRMEQQLHTMSLTDELTGLYNRRGFITLSEQQLKIAERTKKNLLLFFTDLDKMKHINDTFGHQEGDKALIDIATILKDVFRESDIIGRMGGDEFAILAIDTTDETREVLIMRLHNTLDDYNRPEGRNYQLSLSIGIAKYDPEKPCSLDKLMAQADELMYEEKRGK